LAVKSKNRIFDHEFFDFHHHKKNMPNGIYNLDIDQIPDSLYSIGIHPKDIDMNKMTAVSMDEKQYYRKLFCNRGMRSGFFGSY
jgi:hypothetical protein